MEGITPVTACKMLAKLDLSDIEREAICDLIIDMEEKIKKYSSFFEDVEFQVNKFKKKLN